MAAKAQSTAPSYDAFAVAGNQAMKDGVERAVSAFGEFNTFSKDNVEAFVQSMTTAGKGVEQLNSHVVAFTKQAMEDSITNAKRMAGAKSVQEVIEMQTDFAKSSLDAYLGEVNKLTDLVAGSVKDTFKPINARVTATVEMLQAQR